MIINKTKHELLLNFLGYKSSNGYLSKKEIIKKKIPIFSLRQAIHDMDVVGVYGLWQNDLSDGGKRFIPLVYISKTNDIAKAQDVHKKVWCQSKVPFLIIETEENFLLCSGFSYSSKDWLSSASFFKWDILQQGNIDNYEGIKKLESLRSVRLRSSITWRDYALDASNRIDQSLVRNLEKLNYIFTKGLNGCPKLSSTTANSLIGRFLYLFMLLDRNIINNEWFKRNIGINADFSSRDTEIEVSTIWKIFDSLDKLFNGSIFPISASNRKIIKQQHVDFIRYVMRHGCQVDGEGIQLSFVDYHFGSIQTETLSAVYEKFLETENPETRKLDGVFYTPPFVVDFILDCVDDCNQFKPGKSVLDGSAGSGVFLVGAWRRIVEYHLFDEDKIFLTPSKLRSLLIKNIYAIEKNSSACNVAAFSLYVTMLDYVSDLDIDKIRKREITTPLFPNLLGSNIINGDFFDPKIKNILNKKFDIIVGNPPWQSINNISPRHGKGFINSLENDAKVDKERSADAFVWKALYDYSKKDGLVSLLLPTKSFVSPSAKYFAPSLTNNYFVEAFVNLSHFRYKLFNNARHASLVCFIKNRKPNNSDSSWFYSPLMSSQPMRRDGTPWTIMLDKCEIYHVDYSKFAGDRDSIFSLLMLRPVDRHILDYLNDLCLMKKAISFKTFFENNKLEIKRGGSPKETGIHEKYLLSADKHSVKYFVSTLKLEKNIQLEIGGIKAEEYKIPKKILSEVSGRFEKLFSGNVLLLPRSMVKAYYIEQPVAFSSSINAVYFDSTINMTHQHKLLLKAVEKYLSSDFVDYLFTLYGKLWALDRTRLEINDLMRIPIPFNDINDPFIKVFMEEKENKLTSMLCKKFNFNKTMECVVKEFSSLRRGFGDAQIPQNAFDIPSKKEINKYSNIMKIRLGNLTGLNDHLNYSFHEDTNIRMGTFTIRYLEDKESIANENHINDGLNQFIDNDIDIYTSSAHCIISNSMEGYLLKPLEKWQWTAEKAYADAERLLNCFISSH